MGARSGSHCPSPRIMTDPIHLALIDDDEAVLDALRHYFERRNIRTSCFQLANNLLAAIDQGGRFDCIVSDIRMPAMSGLDLAHRTMLCHRLLVSRGGVCREPPLNKVWFDPRIASGDFKHFGSHFRIA